MKRLFAGIFLLCGFAFASQRETAKVVRMDFYRTVSCWGITEPVSSGYILRAKIFSSERVKSGLRAEISFSAAGKKFTVPARVVSVSPPPLEEAVIRPLKRQGNFVGGLFAEADIVTEVRRNAPAVPEEAVLSRDGKKFAVVKKKNGYEIRAIETGLSRKGFAEVKSGLSPGEKVVVRGNFEIFNRDFSRRFKVTD